MSAVPPLYACLPPPGSDADAALEGFLRYAAEAGLTLYPHQEEAILAVMTDSNVIVHTPTGSGKSLIASAVHFKALSEGRRSFYTCPIKALVSEKFFALCRELGPERVGMMTGDATVNRDAPVICCTAEILANIALRNGKDADVDYVVMDEFHYISDKERGVATCAHRFGSCHGQGAGCEPCREETDCPGGLCKQAQFTGEGYCVDLKTKCSCPAGTAQSCTTKDSGCPKAPSGATLTCLGGALYDMSVTKDVCFGANTDPGQTASREGCWPSL